MTAPRRQRIGAVYLHCARETASVRAHTNCCIEAEANQWTPLGVGNPSAVLPSQGPTMHRLPATDMHGHLRCSQLFPCRCSNSNTLGCRRLCASEQSCCPSTAPVTPTEVEASIAEL